LDVGANVGIFTISFSKISKNCMIHSFECDQETFNYLEETVKKNKENNVKIYNFGLSDQNKESIMNCSLIKPGINSLTLDLSKSSNIVQKNVKLKTLDSLNLTNISFIKVDIERHELYFLKGAKNTLINNNATVILEIPCRNEEEIELHNNCVELMKSYGYKFYKKIVDKDYVFRKEEF
jgi:FkbM family methyltransferase